MVFPMNFDAILAPIIEFFSHGIGATIARVGETIYNFLFPSNADSAFPVDTPA